MMRYFWDALDRRDDVEVFCVGPFFNEYIPWNGGMRLPFNYVKVPHIALSQAASRFSLPYSSVKNDMPSGLDLFIQFDAGWHFSDRPNAEIVALVETDPHVLKPSYEIPKAYSDFVFCMQTPYMLSGERYLPYAYDPTIHFPEDNVEQIYDVCLIGLHYPHRDQLLRKLKLQGHNILYDIGLVYDGYRHAYNQSKVALSWSSLQDMPARVWEALAMCVPLVCNRTPDMGSFFVENEHYLGFDDIDGAMEAVEQMLSDPHRADEIALAGYRKVLPHTYDWRITEILETVKLI